MKTKLIGLLLVAGSSLFAETHFSIGVGVGAPGSYGGYNGGGYYANAPVAYRPPCPGPGYLWIDGYYDGYGRWFDGYWDLPPYAGAYWTAPRVYGGRFFGGFWGGPRVYDRGYSFREGYREGFRGGYRQDFREDRRERGGFNSGGNRGGDNRGGFRGEGQRGGGSREGRR